ncbi:MAG: tRNA 2-selenouridine(34) synthase MnmH [Prolixibacteraceae bacterium]|jgi:tRNA 2-selenouridine synthase|nr:tRNA 2-selenouridine(34) synthase MnmH [Prolixibacteraceae bacterium]
MISECYIEDIYQSSTVIIDVRSPGEYEKGHIPRAVNIPLFSNDERAHVGTVYKQQSKEDAIKLGYKYVTPKLQWFIDESIKVAPGREVVVHCWRGGMRSQSFAQHLSENGFSNVQVIKGGYKSYRHFVLNTFEKEYCLRILGGYTGSGKTYILQELKKIGEQVIDLERLANHKGSAFGGINQPQQPTVEQFENNLHEQWLKLDHSKPIWLEDESHNIGADKIPMPLYLQMRNSQLFFLDIPNTERAKHLVGEYANCNIEKLAESIHKIAKRLGFQNEKLAIEMLEQENFYDVAFITLHYYDKSYMKGMSARNKDMVHTIKLDYVNHKKNAETIIQYLKRNGNN